jgi:hypothetical protein
MKGSNKGIYRTYSELAMQLPSESTRKGAVLARSGGGEFWNRGHRRKRTPPLQQHVHAVRNVMGVYSQRHRNEWEGVQLTVRVCGEPPLNLQIVVDVPIYPIVCWSRQSRPQLERTERMSESKDCSALS